MADSTQDFSLSIGRFVALAKSNHDKILRKLALEILTRLVLRSPVGNPSLWKRKAPKGYVGGRFRANWQVGVNVKPSGAVNGIDPLGQSTVARGNTALQKAVAGDIIYVVNNLPYALRIEYGHSTQAPTGVVRVTIAEFRQFIANAIRSVKSGNEGVA